MVAGSRPLHEFERRERLTRRKRWEIQDEDLVYTKQELDRAVVNPDQIRTVIRTFRDKLPEIFPGRESEVPKTLIFAKTDSHADDIIQTVREEFAKVTIFAKRSPTEQKKTRNLSSPSFETTTTPA